MSFNYVGLFECETCGHERTKKMRVKVGKFDEHCPECGVERTYALGMDPMDIDQFGEGLIER